MIKNIIAAFGIVSALASAGLVYPATMQITEIDYSRDVVTMETATGYQYQFYGAEDYMQGDLVSCVMWDTAADNDITNDIIISSRFSGFVAEDCN